MKFCSLRPPHSIGSSSLANSLNSAINGFNKPNLVKSCQVPSHCRLPVQCSVRFRPCIDIHKGKVKQIVGSTLSDAKDGSLVTNFESDKSAAEYAKMYKEDGLTGGHVLMLGADPLSNATAIEALRAYQEQSQELHVVPLSQTFPSSDTGNNRLHMSDSSLASAASTLCSFHEPGTDTSCDNNVLVKVNLNHSENTEEVSHNRYESSFSSSSTKVYMDAEGSKSSLPSPNKLEVISLATQFSDDSDSEIFKVKRRSSVKVERRISNESSNSQKHQGFNRLKRLLPEPKSGDLASSEPGTRNVIKRSDFVKGGENTFSRKDRVDGARTAPLLIRMKKLAQVELTDRREQHENGRSQIAMVKATSNSLSVETGYKRLKVKGPALRE